jgi:hypothetical protein
MPLQLRPTALGVVLEDVCEEQEDDNCIDCWHARCTLKFLSSGNAEDQR